MGCEFIISSISIFVFASLDQILWFRSNLNYLPNLRASPCAMCIVIPHYRIKGASDQLSDQGASRLAPGTLQWSAVLHNNQGLQERARVATCHRYLCSLAGGFTGGGGCLTEEWRERRLRTQSHCPDFQHFPAAAWHEMGNILIWRHQRRHTWHVTAPRYVTSHCGSQLSCHDPRLVWAAQNMRVRWRQWNYRACSKLDVWRKAAPRRWRCSKW